VVPKEVRQVSFPDAISDALAKGNLFFFLAK